MLLVVLIFISLSLTEAKLDKCGGALRACYCGEDYLDHKAQFVVNCTDKRFDNVAVLEDLPEETNILIFTGNSLNTLPSNIFGKNKDLSSLKVIDLSNNGIREIKGKAFHHVTNVERLILNHNNISISDQADFNYHYPRVFSNFNNLLELHLTNAFADNTDAALANDLHDIFVRSNLTKLYKIHLEQNEIRFFKDVNVFCDLPDLHDIYLGDNNIPSLNFNLTCLKKLRYLDLEHNNITKFSQKDLDTFDKLAQPFKKENLQLEIAGNPFRCDVAIKNLYNWLHKTNVVVRHLEKLECHQAKYGRKYIMNLKDFAEAKHAKISKALTVLLCILAIILVTLLSAYVYLKKDNVRNKLSSLFEAVTRKVQYTTIQSQDV